MDAVLARKIPDIAAVCERYGVAHLNLFGSAAGPDFDPDSSDYDFLVELDERAVNSIRVPIYDRQDAQAAG